MSKITQRPPLGRWAAGSDGRSRRDSLRHALGLEALSLGYNVLEAVVGVAAGVAAGSVALVAFGLDAVVESASAGVLIWRLGTERRGRRTAEEAERKAVRLVAVAFGALAVYIGGRAILDLAAGTRPEESTIGIVLAAVSLLVMPVLARAKKAAARELDSRSLEGDSAQTMLCTYMSAVLLFGLATNALWGWWWADPIAGLVIAALAAREARELWVTEDLCCS
ncbi:MAG TPA: cation transporter [Actinomycetota bacterium]|nr:cation transporter [Actinomycetota bacterium]